MQKQHVFNGKLFSVSLKEELPQEFKDRHNRRLKDKNKQNETVVMNYLSQIQQELKSVHQDIRQLQQTNRAEVPEEQKINPREIVSNEELSLFFSDEIEDAIQGENLEDNLASDSSWVGMVVNDKNRDSQELEAHADSYAPWRQQEHQPKN